MLDQLFRNMPPVVKNLLIINVLFFVVTLVAEAQGSYLVGELGIFHFNSPFFKPWQIVTSMFMHGGFLHILFNMFALVSFGNHLENNWGPKEFLKFYLFVGIGATMFSFLIDGIYVFMQTGKIFLSESEIYYATIGNTRMAAIYLVPSVGASGAIFGVFAAFYKFFPNLAVNLMFIPVPIKIKVLFPIALVFSAVMLLANSAGDNIDHGAHLGGALAGLIYIKIFNRNMFNN